MNAPHRPRFRKKSHLDNSDNPNSLFERTHTYYSILQQKIEPSLSQELWKVQWEDTTGAVCCIFAPPLPYYILV
jgi:hypothetical protein